MKYAVCMRCGKQHKYYRFSGKQNGYILYCEKCESTTMHEPSSRVPLWQWILEKLRTK